MIVINRSYRSYHIINTFIPYRISSLSSSPSLEITHFLNAWRVKHDAHSRTERLRRQGSLELSADLSTGSVGTSNFTPNSASLTSVDGLLGAVDKSYTLSQIDWSFRGWGNVFELQDRCGGGLGVLGTTISHMTSFNKESFKIKGEMKWNWISKSE